MISHSREYYKKRRKLHFINHKLNTLINKNINNNSKEISKNTKTPFNSK